MMRLLLLLLDDFLCGFEGRVEGAWLIALSMSLG